MNYELSPMEKRYMKLLDELEELNPGDVVEASRISTEIKNLEDKMWLDQQGENTEGISVTCPDCFKTDVIHVPCGDYVYDCICGDSTEEYYCGWCGQNFDPESEPLEVQSLDDWMSKYQDQVLGGLGFTQDPLPQKPTKDCNSTSRHLHQPVTLPNGVIVHCTAHQNANKINQKPDFGLYADSAWVRTCKWRNEIINWPDFNLPANLDVALNQIEDAYKRCEAGEHVDIGCLGAHGRTGTILAIMVLLATNGDLSGPEACSWVWENYCTHAIENKNQEWYVAYAAGYFFGYDIPDEPEKPVSSQASICLPVEHFAMYSGGRRVCMNPKCSWWEKDIIELYNDKKIAGVSAETLAADNRYPTLLEKYQVKDGTSDQIS